MDGADDPLFTARSGGLESIVPLEEDYGRGRLGETLLCETPGGEIRTAESLRGVKVVELVNGHGKRYAVDGEGKVHDLWGESHANKEPFIIDVDLLSMSVGDGFGAGIGIDNRLYSWGEGADGQLGLGHVRGSRVPEVVRSTKDTEFTMVSCGGKHAAAVTKDGDVYTWGRGFEGQLGQGVHEEIDLEKNAFLGVRLVPKLVQGLWYPRRVVINSVACGSRFTAAIDENGSIWTWGEGLMGQLGTGRCTKRTRPMIAIGPNAAPKSEDGEGQEEEKETKCEESEQESGKHRESVEDYVDILPEDFAVSRKEDSCVVDEEKQQQQPETKDEGPEITQQEEEGSVEQHVTPVTTLMLSSCGSDSRNETPFHFVSIECGEAHVVALDQTGKVVTWGFNAYGQCGTGDTKSRFHPEVLEIDGGQPMRSISACKNASSALSRSGVIYSWGISYGGRGCLYEPQVLDLWNDRKEAKIDLAKVNEFGGVSVLVPTMATGIAPSNGPLEAGYEVTISGVGFWDSELIKVRFIPLKRKDAGQIHESFQLPDSSQNSVDHHSLIDSDDEGADGEDEEDEEQLSVSSGSSGDSDYSDDENDDPRRIEEVTGYYDPVTQAIKCEAPPCVAPGVCAVQVTMDGMTYTTDDVFHIYTEPWKIVSSQPDLACCNSTDLEDERKIVVFGSGLISMPELSIRISSGDRYYDVKATLEVALIDENNPLQQVAASVNVNKVIDALKTNETQNTVHAEVSVSQNGLSYPPANDATKCVFTRVLVNNSEPRAAPCVVDKDDNACEEIVVSLHCEGLVDVPSDDVLVRIQFQHHREGEDASSDELTLQGTILGGDKVQFTCPRLTKQDTMLNGQDWGYRFADVDLTIDKGVNWSRLSGKPFVFYSGEFAQPKPELVPTVNGSEIEFPVAEAQQGWLFPGCDPRITLFVPELMEGGIVVDAITMDEGGSRLSMKVPELRELFISAMNTWESRIRNDTTEAYLNEHKPAEGEDELGEEELNKLQSEAEEQANVEVLKLLDQRLPLHARISMNGGVSITSTIKDSLFLYEPPAIEKIEPSEIVLEQETLTEETEEPTPKLMKIILNSAMDETIKPCGIPTPSTTVLVRFSNEHHTIDIGTSMETKQVEEEEPDNKKSKGKKKDAKKKDAPPEEVFSATRKAFFCTIPDNLKPGKYEVSVSMNGIDFSPSKSELTCLEPPKEEEEENENAEK